MGEFATSVIVSAFRPLGVGGRRRGAAPEHPHEPRPSRSVLVRRLLARPSRQRRRQELRERLRLQRGEELPGIVEIGPRPGNVPGAIGIERALQRVGELVRGGGQRQPERQDGRHETEHSDPRRLCFPRIVSRGRSEGQRSGLPPGAPPAQARSVIGRNRHAIRCHPCRRPGRRIRRHGRGLSAGEHEPDLDPEPGRRGGRRDHLQGHRGRRRRAQPGRHRPLRRHAPRDRGRRPPPEDRRPAPP